MRHIRTNEIKARAEELAETYQDARDDEFDAEFRDMFMSNMGVMKPISEDDIQGVLDSFTFEDEDIWSFNAVQSELDDIADQQYQAYKERDI